MADRDVVERLWRGTGIGARTARAALQPLAWLYGGVMWARSAMYDAGVLASHALAMPAIGVGNLTVGGTGKTPVAAWLAGELRERGATPAVLLRGYGNDEPLVHAALNPGIVVIASPDRRAAARDALARGCDVAVLDDAFQHRRVRRVADLVLVSADRWPDGVHLLPAGPWREAPRALARATLIVVTRKAVALDAAHQVANVLAHHVRVPIAVVHLAPDALHTIGGDRTEPLAALRNTRVLALSAIGDARAFERQLEQLGARVQSAAFADHHHLRDDEIAALIDRATRVERVVCTLKDAVKLGPRWPRATSPIWYVSQRVDVEQGGEAIAAVLTDALAARPVRPSTTPGV